MELLVMMAIILLLSVFIMLSADPADTAKKNRDNRRLIDLQMLEQAIETYYQDNSLTYPDNGAKTTIRKSNVLPSGAGPLELKNGNGWIVQDFGDRLEKLPLDPTNMACNIYRYRVSGDGKYYKLDTVLEYFPSKMTADGGTDESHYEVGNDPISAPIDMGVCP